MKKVLFWIVVMLCCAALADAQTKCGTERWPVKTLADPQGDAIFNAPATVSTIEELSAIPAPTRKELMEATNTRFPAEVAAGRKLVHVAVLGFKLETDSDIHVVIANPKNLSSTMVTEIPSPACVPPKYRSYIAGVRASFIQAFGAPTPRMKHLAKPRLIQAEGPLFFDFIHGQTGVAKNGAELHPLLFWKSE